ncbi:unnamed protein product [Orchesella dallaii]|uniref:Uncharacterized protein n=1 Tax=Orchesella dallaii TaxID=48710 RepID=A0ABP1PI00_9HEXA
MVSIKITNFIVVYTALAHLLVQANRYITPNLPNCLIHILNGVEITSESKDESTNAVLQLLFEKSTTLSYTSQQIQDFSLLLGHNNTDYFDEDFDPEKVNVDSQSGFLRFNVKYSSSCMVFLIKSQEFNETLIAIQRSGHGTSDEVLFIIETIPHTEENDIINGFVNEFFSSEGMPFHAPIAFFNPENNEIATFCYFCQPSSAKIRKIPHGSLTSWDTLPRSHHSQINDNGYGNQLIVPDSFAHSTAAAYNCLKHYDSRRVRTNLFGEHVNCSLPDVWIVASIQSILNVSITFKGSTTEEDKKYQKWMLQARFGEGLAQRIPNIYAYTRGFLIIAEHMELDLMACLHTQQLQTFQLSISSALDLTSWYILIILVLLYGYVCQNVWKGLDLLWTVSGKELTMEHGRTCVCIVLIALSVLSYVYESTLSADSMQLTRFPDIKTLMKEDYRLWLAKTGPISAITRTLSNLTKNSLQSYLGVDPRDPKIFFAGKNDQSISSYYSNRLGMLLTAAKYKLLITSITCFNMLKVIGKNLVSVNENLVCQVDRTSRHVELSFVHTVRIWGYLSRECYKLLSTLFSNGEYVRLRRLKLVKEGIQMKSVKLSNTDTLIVTKPIDMISAVGICCWVVYVVGGLLFIWWCIGMLKIWHIKFKTMVFNLKRKLRCKSQVHHLKSDNLDSASDELFFKTSSGGTSNSIS